MKYFKEQINQAMKEVFEPASSEDIAQRKEKSKSLEEQESGV